LISATSTPGLDGGSVRFTMTLASAIGSAATMNIATASIGAATTDPADGFARSGSACDTEGTVDFVAPSSTLTVPAGSSVVTLDVKTCANKAVEANERFALDVTWNGRSQRVEGLIVNSFPGGLNDTGATACLNSAGALVDCKATDLPGQQDGTTGRDALALTASAADGRVGFSYSRYPSTGCITDVVTGLTWSDTVQNAATWGIAQTLPAAANTAVRCGFNDWRIPTTQELLGLVDAGAAPSTPMMDSSVFTASAVDHWSADSLTSDTNQGWLVSFSAGLSATKPKNNPFGDAMVTRLVRGGANASAECNTDNAQRYVAHGDGTVTDKLTGLMWQFCADGLSGTQCATGTATVYNSFGAALRRAVQVNADAAGAGRGHNDWRVPNRNELASLVQTACSAPAINRVAFPGTPATASETVGTFWSSTPAQLTGLTDQAWKVNFIDGQVLFASSTNSAGHLRLVRAGQ
jgi:hypothetical protein